MLKKIIDFVLLYCLRVFFARVIKRFRSDIIVNGTVAIFIIFFVFFFFCFGGYCNAYRDIFRSPNRN